MKRHAPKEEIEHVLQELTRYEGLKPVPLFGVERTVIAVIGDERILDEHHVSSLPGVDKVMLVLKPYKLASRETKHENTLVKVGDVTIGGTQVIMMAGPCAVESEEQIEEAAAGLKKAGAHIMRAGGFKPRTSPHSFQGLGRKGVLMLEKAAKEHGIPTVSEVMDVRDVDFMCNHVDMLQIGARNMQNYDLLKEIGKTKKPVLLKRSMSSTIKELLLAAEYILTNGNQNVVLCERGIRTFEDDTRNTFALATVPLVKELSHLPIIADPSHGTGKISLILPMAKAAVAAGADGIMIEVHPHPDQAQSDADQALTFEQFDKVMKELSNIAQTVNRSL